MHPRLDPTRPVLWRDASTVQVGLDPATAVLLTDLPPGAAALLARLDGTLSRDDLRQLAAHRTGRPGLADELLSHLESGGALSDPAPARAAAWVEVRGAGRIGAHLAALLAAECVGTVTVVDTGTATAADVTPGGLGRRDIGRGRAGAALDVLRAARPTRTAPDSAAPASQEPDLAVVAPVAGLGRVEVLHLLAAGVPHLLVRVCDGAAIVGPLVLPGRTSCVRCADLTRTDRDPAWPRLLGCADAGGPPAGGAPPALAALGAALAAEQVLGWLDGQWPAAVDAELVVRRGGALPRRRSWQPHPACGCRWTVASGDRGSNAAGRPPLVRR